MRHKVLGKTGLEVSELSLGTVELGVEYGIIESGRSNQPEKADAVRLISHALDLGINLFDTAPNYGTSEELLGEVIGSRDDCYIATKVNIPESNKPLEIQSDVEQSLRKSMKDLKRGTLDIVQIHNATEETVQRGDVVEALLKAKEKGIVRFTGASVYGAEAALAVVSSGAFDVVQIAYSILDQSMAEKALPAARKKGVGVINRSALLKGVLTERAKWLPEELKPLREASEKVMKTFNVSWENLPDTALRFCVSSEYTDTVLVGVNKISELEKAVSAVSRRLFDREDLNEAKALSIDDEKLVNPSHWPI